MRVLLYTLNFAPELTGIGKYSAEMADWLVAQGHDVDVVCAVPYYPEWRVHEGYGGWRYRHASSRIGAGSLTVWRCPLWVPRRPSGLKRIVHLASFAVSSLPVLVRAMFTRPDLVFVVAPALMVVPQALALSGLARRRTWLHVQDFEVDAALGLGLVKDGWLGRLARAIESFLLKRFDHTSTISEAMAQRLKEKGVSPERVFMLPNWVDLNAISPLPAGPNEVRQELGIDDDTTLLLYSGNMGEKQGLDVVVDAARLLHGAPNIKLLMVGTGAAKGRLQAMASDLDNIVWWPLQPVERLNALLGAADIHLLPQRADAADLVMPSKLGGMLASGRMVVGTAMADTELGKVLDAVGIRVEPGRADLLAKAIAERAPNRAHRLERGAAGRKLAEEKLGIDMIMSRFVARTQGTRR